MRDLEGMPAIKSFRELLVWQKAMDLCVLVCNIARRFPRDEQMALGFQLRKSAISMPSNIAEGFSRHSTASYIQHLWIAHASVAELQTQVLIGSRIGLIQEPIAAALIADGEEIARMTAGLVRALERGR